MHNLLAGRFSGPFFCVNPRYGEVMGVPCFPTLAALPEPVEHVVFAVSDERLEAALEAAIDHGARAVTIMSTMVLAGDREPPLVARIRARVRDTGLLVCGGNGMGFYNFNAGVRVCGFATRDHQHHGYTTYISHSGSGMCGIVDVDARIDFNLVVSTGNELVVTMADYIDYALDQPDTRVIGLFMETVREPAAFVAALDKADRLRIPVVALKAGRTPFAAKLALSHSGALAGSDATYEALFDRYGVHRVRDMDEMATALILFSQPHPVAPGGLVSLHDSGGERELLIDLAQDAGVPLGQLRPASSERLQQILDPGLPPVNPLDAWSTGQDANRVMSECLATLLADDDAAIGALVLDRVTGGEIAPQYLQYLEAAHAASGKPVCLVANRQGTGCDARVVEWTRRGFPVIDGIAPFLRAVRCLIEHRDRPQRAVCEVPVVAQDAVRLWRARLEGAGSLDEMESITFLGAFGLPVNSVCIVNDEEEALTAAAEIGYPLVMKTAAPGVAHKTDLRGVKLDLADPAAIIAAYRDLEGRLGPRVLLAPMRRGGVEMMLGMTRDPQFGPVVVIGFGGIHAELLNDVRCAIPPFDAAMARRLVDSLRLRPLLDGRRGAPPSDLESFCEAAARFSAVVDALRDVLAEVDLNPVLVGVHGCCALDALVVTLPGDPGGAHQP